MTERVIIHLDMDNFFVACERRMNPKLEGKPVVVGGSSDRGVVSSCSYEARKLGIHSAMPIKQAKALCPHAIFIPGNMSLYSHYSTLITSIIEDKVPLYEKASVDEFYIDASGMDRYFGCYKWASELRNTIMKKSGLPLSMGISSSKTVSKIATGEAKPNGQIHILNGQEKSFLAPLSIKKIPMVGAKTYVKLKNIGIEYIKTVQETPLKKLEHILGMQGTIIWNKCNGIDTSPIIPWRERKSISKERTFEIDTNNRKNLTSVLIGMADGLAMQLRNENKFTACVTVHIRYSNMQTFSKQMNIPYSDADHQLIKTTLGIFNELYKNTTPLRLVGVRYSQLTDGGYQTNLFENSEKLWQLYRTMDQIRNQFGKNGITRSLLVD